jgi:hypothetical protein
VELGRFGGHGGVGGVVVNAILDMARGELEAIVLVIYYNKCSCIDRVFQGIAVQCYCSGAGENSDREGGCRCLCKIEIERRWQPFTLIPMMCHRKSTLHLLFAIWYSQVKFTNCLLEQ